MRDDRPDHALAGVVLVASAARRRGEYERVGGRVRVGVAMGEQLVAQRGKDVDGRIPASVLASPTEILPLARSTSIQRSAVASPMRRPAYTSVAIRARRPAVRACGLASSSLAASIIAAICSAESRYTGRLRLALSLRLRVFTRT